MLKPKLDSKDEKCITWCTLDKSLSNDRVPTSYYVHKGKIDLATSRGKAVLPQTSGKLSEQSVNGFKWESLFVAKCTAAFRDCPEDARKT